LLVFINKDKKIVFFVEKIHYWKNFQLYLYKNWYSGVFEVADYESEVRFWKFKMADPRRRPKSKIFLNFFFFETWYREVFEVADYKFEVRFEKFEMADPRWRPKSKIFLDFVLKLCIKGFLGSLITNLKSDFENSESWIQYGDLQLQIINFIVAVDSISNYLNILSSNLQISNSIQCSGPIYEKHKIWTRKHAAVFYIKCGLRELLNWIVTDFIDKKIGLLKTWNFGFFHATRENFQKNF